MSLCPTKDIHSIYLDNELPLTYVKEYEEHIKSCSKCSAELENLKKIRELMNSGSRPELSQLEMDEGFKRLMIRKSYSKHTKGFESGTSSVWKSALSNTVKYAVPAIAAAAVFALVIPLGMNAGKKGSPAATVAEAPAAAPVTVLPVTASTVSMNGMQGMAPMRGMRMHHGMGPRPVSGQEGVTAENMPQVVDVFRPNFDNENKISIQITFPGINSTPYTTEIGLPVDMYKGSSSETN